MNITFASVFFDWDSTLSRIEGIDELARQAPPAERRAVEQATADAMAGRSSLEEVYGRRLDAVAPDRAALTGLAERYDQELMPDAPEVVASLQFLGKCVGVISGGLLPAVAASAQRLGIDPRHVHAVPVRLDEHGHYAGFDQDFPLARSGGKQIVLDGLHPQLRPLCFVGDGITDLEAAAHVERFIGFGGAVRRPEVERAATHYCREPRLAPVLNWILTDEERAQMEEHPRFRTLLTPATEH